ncbi:hypothetical protein GF325_04530 [Candidatus Bathyarchaeota archaeon]|nr:hypothetical protein [Candidatus Bathyarchaeota archaeon]
MEQGEKKKELVEKFKQEYELRKKKIHDISIVLFCIAIGLAITAVVVGAGGGGLYTGFHIGSFLGALFAGMGAGAAFMIGICIYASGKADTLVPYIKKRLRQVELSNTDNLMRAVDDEEETGDAEKPGSKSSEKVIIKEIVKVRCPYCRALVDVSEPICTECGGTL